MVLDIYSALEYPVQGINWGFSSKPKPWTYMEQEKAADNKTKRSMEEKERIDALQKALQ